MDYNKRNSVLVDTSFFIALAISQDQFHSQAKKLAKKYSKKEWITTWPVLTELAHLLPIHCAQELLHDQQKGLFHLFSISNAHIPRMIQLMSKYKDHLIDLADLSLILLAEELGHGEILSFDEQDFTYLKWRNSQPFQILTEK